ncbi:DUF3883 domain-containing protein (plasmid) [Sphingomonas aliaeris]|uniref:DUF3883 domain-containing protein n=1 Tax=Sphingomonas aliaeris TaxID=2759526 RepID=A0A974NY74_9SPHN|nr:DUF3883 domain-containing protein [Sphingomonas aliaeris]QQV79259.1 DUF3883 domain-containing protein [Sphingomonas aliaeris]
MTKLLWVKFGWSEYYRGGPVDGNFPFIKDGEQGHEAWNFLRQDDGSYYCYTPPQGRDGSTPSNADATGWTVACLAKDPKQKGVHLVGWYENAVLEGKYAVRPAGFDSGASAPHDEFYYSIRAPKAFLVPPDERTEPFSHTSIRQGKYSLLAGPGVHVTDNKAEVRAIIEELIRRYTGVAIPNPDPKSAPDRDNDPVDPLRGFGTPEHRKKVEEAAVTAAVRELKKLGYTSRSREKENVGYDLEAVHKNGSALHVEVKGTSGAEPRLFMTRNEHDYREAPEWRLAMVVDALGTPDVRVYTLREFERAFDLAPLVWKGVRKAAV